LKEEALDRTVWRTRIGRGYGSVVRQTAWWWWWWWWRWWQRWRWWWWLTDMWKAEFNLLLGWGSNRVPPQLTNSDFR
jgi:hypothetical protein